MEWWGWFLLGMGTAYATLGIALLVAFLWIRHWVRKNKIDQFVNGMGQVADAMSKVNVAEALNQPWK